MDHDAPCPSIGDGYHLAGLGIRHLQDDTAIANLLVRLPDVLKAGVILLEVLRDEVEGQGQLGVEEDRLGIE